jgi:hypothetical protein
MTPLLKLPIGIQAFETMREQGYVFVDKTRWIHHLATEGMFYFMSRPRRFGKSLSSSNAGKAPRQIRERGYAARYAQSGKTVTLIGIHFDPEQRNLAEWRVEGV